MLKKMIKISPVSFLLAVTMSTVALATAKDDYLKQLETKANSLALKTETSQATSKNEFFGPEKAHNTELTRLIETTRSIKQNPDKLARAIYEGENRAVLCVYCHGKDGNSLRPNIPNLAAQTPEYLVTQFELFSNGKRKNITMEKLSETLSFNDKVNIALYFSGMKVKPKVKAINKTLYEQGKRVYGNQCAQCHGNQAHGNHQMPYLAGQKKAYISQTLTLLREGDISRMNSPMIPIAQKLSNNEIQSLAEYLSALH